MGNVDISLQMELYLKVNLIKECLKNKLIILPDILLDGSEDNGKMDQLMVTDKYIAKMEYYNTKDKWRMDINMDKGHRI